MKNILDRYETMKSKIILLWKPLLAVMFWGNSFIATKIALRELNPLTIITMRLLLSIILLGSIALFTKRDFRISVKNHSWILLLAAVAVFHLWIQITGLNETTASNTGWIIGFTPVFIAILGILFFGERLKLVNTFGMLLAFCGLVLLISKGNIFSIGLISHKGDLLVLASTVTWSFYSILNKKISITYSPMMMILYLFIMMMIIVAPLSVNGESIHSVLTLPAEGWGAVLFLGIFCSGIAYVLWAQSLKDIDASKVGAFLYVEPFFTVISAGFILGEKISLLMLFSGIVITIGVILVNKKFVKVVQA